MEKKKKCLIEIRSESSPAGGSPRPRELAIFDSDSAAKRDSEERASEEKPL